MMFEVRIFCFVLACIFHVHCSQVNVALHKPASTTSGILTIQSGTWSPSGAVDGDHVTLNDPSSCFHSDRAPADWTVDLGQEYQLYNITVYIRIDLKIKGRYNYRTANSSIYLNNDPSRVCYTFPSTISDNPTHLTCNETARYVTIRNPGNEGAEDSLNICEVEIYACPAGYRGVNCEVDCHCDECDRWTGVCSSICRPSWEGERCDIACKGTYGSNCVNSCADRHCSDSSSSCDPVNGTCDSGCLPGWTGVDWCPSSTYGSNCLQSCRTRHCFGNSTCDHVTGSCDQGCERGWKSVDCTKACNGSYGFNCANSCVVRHCSNSSSSCEPVNGTCDSVCLAGWAGPDCFTECQVSTFGLNCSKSCANRHCKDTSTCDHVTGSCDQGCESGWKSINCMTECTEGEEFGPNCSGSCTERHCLNQSSCNPVYGLCENGCEIGWEGLQCMKAADVPDSTTTIALSTTVGVLVVFIVVILTILLISRRHKNGSSDKKSSVARSTPDPSPSTNQDIEISATPSNYATLQATEDNHYTGLERRDVYEKI